MAETTCPLILRGASLVFTDASGTPKTYTVLLDGSVSFTNGGHEIVRGRDTNGDFYGIPRQGQQAGVSTMELSGVRIYGAGSSTTEAALIDFIMGNGPAVSGWLGTGNITTERKPWNVTLNVPDVTVSPATTVKGAIYSLIDCLVQPGAQLSPQLDGFRATATFESPEPYITITINP